MGLWAEIKLPKCNFKYVYWYSKVQSSYLHFKFQPSTSVRKEVVRKNLQIQPILPNTTLPISYKCNLRELILLIHAQKPKSNYRKKYWNLKTEIRTPWKPKNWKLENCQKFYQIQTLETPNFRTPNLRKFKTLKFELYWSPSYRNPKIRILHRINWFLGKTWDVIFR